MEYIIITLWELGALGILLTAASFPNNWSEKVDWPSTVGILFWPISITVVLFLMLYDSIYKYLNLKYPDIF